MANAQYEIYIASVLSLARSMAIKCEAVADAINRDLDQRYLASGGELQYLVNPSAPMTWKYYLNLAGQYHLSDTLMTVTSQDTLQTINFTVDNLQQNTATALAYAPGGRYFNDLVARYPAQESLIRGILHPVALDVALSAEDGTVLWYDPTLVESNEYDLIPRLTQWVKNYLARWNVEAYSLVDDLYTASMLKVMYDTLPLIVLKLRLEYCHTYQTHSFHITQFLASHGRLDEFVSSLTKPQMLWLYRNVRYLQRNPGAQGTFQSLIDNLLTTRGLPLSDWTMRHDLSATQASLKAVPIFQRGQLNLALSDGGVELRNVTQMLIAEEAVAKDNNVQSETVTEVTDLMTYSLSDNLNTKVLESSLLDLTDAAPYTLSDCLINHWLYLAALGRYTAVISVENPKTGDTYTLSVADAFVVYIYTFLVSKGLECTHIPMLWANKVRKLVTPPPEEIRNLVDMSVLSEADLQAVYTGLPAIARTYISISSFNSACRAIHAAETYQHALFSTQGHLWARAYLETATLYLYTDYRCDLGAGQAYSEWFNTRGLDIATLSLEQMATVSTSILVAATGANLAVVESMADLQSAMLRLMTRLSSYSVQFLGAINTSPIKVLERASIRLGDTAADGATSTAVVIPHGELTDFNGTAANRFEDVTIGDVTVYGFEATASAAFDMDLNVRPVGGAAVEAAQRLSIPLVGLRRVDDGLDFTIPPGLITKVPDYQPLGLKSLPEAFTDLTLEFYHLDASDKAVLKNRYLMWLTENGTPIGNLSDLLTDTLIPPFR